jgi:protein-S-isoprenylcysteine O-methyltransferase Ste14
MAGVSSHSASKKPYAQAWSNLTTASVLGILERIAISLMFAYFAFRMLSEPPEKVGFLTIFLVVSESLSVILVLFQRKLNAYSDRLGDWFLGFAGASLPLLAVAQGPAALLSQPICGGIMLLGLFVQISAKLILGRSFGIVAANRGVKVAGPYRFVRHPMYAGYIINQIGFLLAFPSLWNAILYSSELMIQITRILREEAVLNKDRTYRDYASQVRYRLVPMVF